jgi:hypothetical protein
MILIRHQLAKNDKLNEAQPVASYVLPHVFFEH